MQRFRFLYFFGLLLFQFIQISASFATIQNESGIQLNRDTRAQTLPENDPLPSAPEEPPFADSLPTPTRGGVTASEDPPPSAPDEPTSVDALPSSDQLQARTKISVLENIMKIYAKEHTDGFISLPSGNAIAQTGITQELWVKVMNNNPSNFKERRYCPDSFRVSKKYGKEIAMCPDLPVNNIRSQSIGEFDSDDEFLVILNSIYEAAHIPTRFRRSTLAEYNYADTVHGSEIKRETDSIFDLFTVCWENSDHAAYSPSGNHQPRSMTKILANSLGFRRSGVWEWTEDYDSTGSNRVVVGKSYFNPARKRVQTGFIASQNPAETYEGQGPARLVKINLTH